ncbi:DUF692 domain-containing protein [Alteromonas sp. 5E99-2]|uniref:MNIO family bufferin maturase n=1 Tax=Alteromonas sp. 5E99-2 TaxID=2817683 RepID=UPI001A981D76|nr:DUF692 domain-containing protein [Alteromonas sp. 5E99-2]MBO1254691.1 DUF692 domain-containing protein [Alteromonas sp. 5E99-2]
MITSLPADAGIGLKPEFFSELHNFNQPGLWFEIHAENYLIDGGPRLQTLQELANKIPLSIHGVGASLGSPEPVCKDHLARIKKLCDSVKVASFSEHIAWSGLEGHYFNNLMPVPRTKASLAFTADNIHRVQDTIQRPILVENPSNYIEMASDYGEAEFLMELVHKTGCGVLLDVNNLFISSKNIAIDLNEYIQILDANAIGEIHVAGHSYDPNDKNLLIDSHDAPVSHNVWELLRDVISQTGKKPVLIERDANLPPLAELMKERDFASQIIQSSHKELAHG